LFVVAVACAVSEQDDMTVAVLAFPPNIFANLSASFLHVQTYG